MKFNYECLPTLSKMFEKEFCFIIFDLESGSAIILISTHNFGNFWVFLLTLNFHNTADSKTKAANRSSGTQGSNAISFSKFCLSAKACCLFTKMLKPFVGRWRSQGVASIVYIDDGIAGCSSKQQASEASHSIQSDLIRNAGWKADNQKSCWEPLQIGEWLGIIVNTIQAICIVPEKKIRKAKAVSNGLFLDFANVRVLGVARIRRFRDFFHFGHGQWHSDFHETNVFK